MVTCQTHYLKIAGSTPAPAPKLFIELKSTAGKTSCVDTLRIGKLSVFNVVNCIC